MNKKTIKIIAIILSIVVIITGGYYYIKKNSSSKTAATNVSYMTETVKKGQIDVNIKVNGTVYASVTKDVAANNSGELKNLNVSEGDTVKAGDVLFKADSDQIRQQLSSAELNLEKQRLQDNKMQNDNEKNLQNLNIKEAENNYNNALKQYNNMTVKAPISGLVIAKNNITGDNVQSGKAVLTIMDTSSLKIKTSIDELDVSKIVKGQSVQIQFNAIEGKTYEGTVESISEIGKTQNNVATYDAVIALKDNTGVKVGMTAAVNIQVASKNNVLLAPIEALTLRNGKYYVMTAADSSSSSNQSSTENNQGNTNTSNNQGSNNSQKRNAGSFGQFTQTQGKMVEVKIGLKNENFVEITEGLTEGQKLLVTIPQTNSNSTTRNNNRGFGTGMPSGGFGMPNGR